MSLSDKQILQLAVAAANDSKTSKKASFEIAGTKHEFDQKRIYVSNLQSRAKADHGSHILDSKGAALASAQGLNRSISDAIKVFCELMVKHGQSEAQINERRASLRKAVVKVVDDPTVGDQSLQQNADALDSFFNELLA